MYLFIGVAALLLALVAAPFFIDVDDYRQRIEQEVEDATGRSLHIGAMHASLFPWVGLRLDDVVLADAVDFGEEPFLRVARLDVQIAFLPLLQKRVEIRHFILDTPEILLRRDADGRGNWEDLTGDGDTEAAASAPTRGSASPIPMALVAESIELRKGHLRWLDGKSGRNIEIQNMELRIEDVQQERPISVHASLDIGKGHLELKGKLGPVGDFSRFRGDRLPLQLRLRMDGLPLAALASSLPEVPMLGDLASARLNNEVDFEQRQDGVRIASGRSELQAARMLAVQWSVEQRDAEHVLLQSADIALDQRSLLHIQGDVRLRSSPQLSLQVRSEVIQRQWLSELLPSLRALYAKHPAPWQKLDFGLLAKWDGKRWTLSDMKLHLNQELVTLSGAFTPGDAPLVRLQLQSDRLHLDPWLPSSEKGSEPADHSTGRNDGDEVEPDLRSYADWRLDLHAEIGRLHARDLLLQDVVLDIQEEKGVLQLSPLSFRMAEGTLRERGSVNLSVYPVSWEESLQVQGLRIGPLLRQLADSDRLDGVLDLHTALHGKGLLSKNIRASLTGKGRMEMRDGRIKGFDIAGALRNITSLGQQKGPQYTDFAQLQASFTARDGVIENKDLFMASPLFRLTGQGTIDLPASRMDYHMRPRLVGTLVGQGDQAKTRSGVAIPLHISGPWDAPSVRPELDAGSVIGSVQNMLQQGGTPSKKSLVDTPVKAAREKVNRALGGLLPGF